MLASRIIRVAMISFLIQVAYLAIVALLIVHRIQYGSFYYTYFTELSDVYAYFRAGQGSLADMVIHPPLAIAFFRALYLASFGNIRLFYLLLYGINILLNIGTSVLLYEICKKYFEKNVALNAVVLFNVAPPTLFFSTCRIEPLPVFLTVASIYLMLQKSYLASFIMLATGALVRIYPIFLLLPYLVYLIREREQWIAVLGTCIFLSYNAVAWATTGLSFILSFLEVRRPGITPLSLLLSRFGMPQSTITLISACILATLGGVLALRSINLFKNCAIMLMSVIPLFTIFHEQYVLWFIPLLAVYAAVDRNCLLGFLVISSISYIGYPLSWNLHYHHSPAWLTVHNVSWALIFAVVTMIAIYTWSSKRF